MTAKRQVWGVVVGIVIIIAGLLFGSDELWPTLRTERSSKHWARTPCLVLASSVKKRFWSSTGGDSHFNWIPIIKYQYEVAGKKYTSDKENLVSNVAQRRSEGEAMAFAARFPQGSTRTCFVNPADPQQAVLVRSVPLGDALWMWGMPLAIVGIGIFFIVGGLLGKLHGPNWVAAQPRSFDRSKQPPGRGLTAHVEGEALVLSAGPHLASLVVGGLVIAFGAAVLAQPLIGIHELSSVPWWVGLAGLAFGVFMVGYQFLVVEELLVSATEVTRRLRTPWGDFRQKSLGVGAIDEVIVDYDPVWNSRVKGERHVVRSVQIASSLDRIRFGMTLSEKQRLWVQDCILETIGE